ncbi:hypothetical protein ACS0TY_021158 [Phlomoides rotata]
MVLSKGIPEFVWVSAVGLYFLVAGVAGVETVKGVFLGLLEHCHVSAGAAIRVVNRVIGNGLNNGEGRVELVNSGNCTERIMEKKIYLVFLC